MLYLKNVTAVTPTSIIAAQTIILADGLIRSVESAPVPIPDEAQVIDAEGYFVAPGFIDLQLNGGFGYDFTQNPETIWEVAAQLPRYGVTSFLPTIITSPLTQIAKAQAVLDQADEVNVSGARVLGLHLEGPFLNIEKKGAHNPAYLQLPQAAAVRDWSPQTGVRLVTLAPELPGAAAVIEQLDANGVVVSMGHSMATYAEAMQGLDQGIRYGTHLFNAMRPLHHREPGLIGTLLSDERAIIGIIPDEVHVHPGLIKAAWRAAQGRLNIITDGMAAMGMPPGQYQLNDQRVTVDTTSVRLADGTLAGSIVTMDAAVRYFKAYTGCTLAEAIAAVTTTPARLLRLDDQLGQIAPGYTADLVLLSPELEVAATIVSGRLAYSNEEKFKHE